MRRRLGFKAHDGNELTVVGHTGGGPEPTLGSRGEVGEPCFELPVEALRIGHWSLESLYEHDPALPLDLARTIAQPTAAVNRIATRS